MDQLSTAKWLVKFNQYLAKFRFRGAIFLYGDLDWALDWLNNEASIELSDFGLIYSDMFINEGVITYKNYRHQLGTENTSVFFADSDFNVDAFAALSGTIVAGGICYIWLPQALLANHSGFIKRLTSHIDDFSEVLLCKQGDELTLPEFECSDCSNTNIVFSLPTIGQRSSISAIKKVVTGKTREPLVITADRGRGKSTALAIAVSELMAANTRNLHIVITAPHRMATNIFFSHLERLCVNSTVKGSRFTWQKHQVDFIPVDELIHDKPLADLIFVDEAAGIPVYLLEQVIRVYNRVVFSSTIHGYEGAGKGFSNKFLPLLAKHSRKIKECYLNEPIRWANNDPLEAFVFNTCMLNAELVELTDYAEISKQKKPFKYGVYSGDELVNNARLLSQTFAILITAHYQTKPSDLRLMLDDPTVSVHILLHNDEPVAVALVVTEHPLTEQLQAEIIAEKRRIKGHLLTQLIAQQLLRTESFNYSYQRVMRIAVHPRVQGKGLGTHLLNEVVDQASQARIDFIGTSFAASSQVVSFWRDNDFKPIKLGFNRDASSGEHSLVMLKALNSGSSNFSNVLVQEFYREFPHWLPDEFKALDYSLIALVLSMSPIQEQEVITERDRLLISSFTQNANLYSKAKLSLSKWLQYQLSVQTSELESYYPLIAKTLMHQNDSKVVENFGFTGKKALYQALQELIELTF
ncbi:tRNA(Met) cytidine acetyltransferase [Thalassotalea sp. M1531]|uniref:tRNA(Met) cytidine acetyltransferase TmcA n=1 Tax=Thalassotalea algicola TaxID=2716224 RepID=A0A7Y0Q789_9GAMM|nr:GNAT family N-acetyltransferase [Thalassotalea algicola]NMP32223.1 tRNA(Met) cytidine acetyltransferase [Thalassotalea algicola]